MNRDAALPTFRLSDGASLVSAALPQSPPVTLDSPALDVVTDLTQVRAATIDPATPLRAAEQAMIVKGVRMLFVVNAPPAIVGLVTTTDLHGDRQMQLVNERRLRYDELSVADVMTPLAQIDALDHAALRSASVGNLVATLKRFGRNHLLVVEAGGRIRGVVSRSQIERQLGTAITITPIASSFSEIERALV